MSQCLVLQGCTNDIHQQGKKTRKQNVFQTSIFLITNKREKTAISIRSQVSTRSSWCHPSVFLPFFLTVCRTGQDPTTQGKTIYITVSHSGRKAEQKDRNIIENILVKISLHPNQNKRIPDTCDDRFRGLSTWTVNSRLLK